MIISPSWRDVSILNYYDITLIGNSRILSFSYTSLPHLGAQSRRKGGSSVYSHMRAKNKIEFDERNFIREQTS